MCVAARGLSKIDIVKIFYKQIPHFSFAFLESGMIESDVAASGNTKICKSFHELFFVYFCD